MNPRAFTTTPVRLDAPSTPADVRVWVMVALEGNYKGYQGGHLEFTFDQAFLTKLIDNFHKHPSYKRGASGSGEVDVVPWDYHHASEQPAAMVGPNGAPATGWISDLKLGRRADGRLALYALTRWLEPARTQVRNGQYRFASVSVVLDAIDPVTGKAIGPVLTSVALTNQPFIEGMQPLAASRNALAHHYSKGPTTMKEAILSKARELLSAGEPTAAMALSKAAAELCPGLTHDERWVKWVHPLLAENNLAMVRHAVANGGQLARASRRPR